jgi:two-component system CheB/CheR fusion protein
MPHYLIAFEEARSGDTARSEASATDARPDGDDETSRRIRALQDELEANRDYLQSTIQDLEATNEELQAANEEILSSNEELQSTNEELDTAKEELQSTNEELHTVNDELEARNRQLVLANSDLNNLLASVDIAIVMVSMDLHIRRFTPVAERLFNLIDSDVGRPIGYLRPRIDCPDLEDAITTVIDRMDAFEREVRDERGTWYSLRIRPYKNLDNRIDGAVLLALDIDANKRHAIELQEAHRHAEALLECIEQPLLVLDKYLRVVQSNRGFGETFRVTALETQGHFVYDLGNGQWDIPELRRLLEELLPQRGKLDDYRVTHDFPQIGRCTMTLSARAIENAESGIDTILLVIRATRPSDGEQGD